MRIRILAVGRIKEQYLKEGTLEFQKRLQPYCRLEVVEVDPASSLPGRPRTADLEKARQAEGQRLLQALDPDYYNIALDERGRMLDSPNFSRSLSRLQNRGRNKVCFIIGGAFGLSEMVREKASYLLAFSRMTFTHEMMRLILLEQVYRAFKIMNSEPYHY